MELTTLEANAQDLDKELQWFEKVLDTRIKLYFNNETEYASVFDITPPNFTGSQSNYAKLITHYPMSFSERIVLVMALIPHVRPYLLDILYAKNQSYNRGYTEFGGINGKYHGGMLPTGETVNFILSGDDLVSRFHLSYLFEEDHYFHIHNIVTLSPLEKGQEEPRLSNILKISDEYISLLTSGKPYKPDYSTKFPAKRITTKLNWKELILNDGVREEIDDIITWIQHGDTLMEDWGLNTKVKNGYRAMFYGPPGTGKTLTACLIGQSLDLDVYRIDLSMVVSKYIGETEKNLASVFDQAENKNWILFFDEADALFGKRTATNSSNDRHANQEVAYLLQRIEDFNGVVILASNLKGNLDEAFSRRFQSMIYFPVPDNEQRLMLWQNAFQDKLKLEAKVDLRAIAENHIISGGSITNVLRYCAIKAIQRDSHDIQLRDIENGIRKEQRKEGKS
jgi:hypothetical protein